MGEDRALRGPGAGLGAKASCYISPRAPRGASIAPHSLWPPAHRCASPRMGALSGCLALLWALVALLSAGTAGKDAAPHSPRTAGVAPRRPIVDSVSSTGPCVSWTPGQPELGEVGTSGKTEGLGFGDGRGWHWVRGPSWGVSLVSVRPPPTAARRGGRVSTKGAHEELHFPLCPRGWPRQ